MKYRYAICNIKSPGTTPSAALAGARGHATSCPGTVSAAVGVRLRFHRTHRPLVRFSFSEAHRTVIRGEDGFTHASEPRRVAPASILGKRTPFLVHTASSSAPPGPTVLQASLSGPSLSLFLLLSFSPLLSLKINKKAHPVEH